MNSKIEWGPKRIPRVTVEDERPTKEPQANRTEPSSVTLPSRKRRASNFPKDTTSSSLPTSSVEKSMTPAPLAVIPRWDVRRFFTKPRSLEGSGRSQASIEAHRRNPELENVQRRSEVASRISTEMIRDSEPIYPLEAKGQDN